MNKQTVVHPFHGILFGNWKGMSFIEVCENMDESLMYIARGKKKVANLKSKK